MNLTFSEWSLGNSQKSLTTNQFLVSTIFFTIMNVFFFWVCIWSLFNHRQRSYSNQEQCSLCCNSPCFLVLLCTHYGPLQCFSTYFRELKEIGVLRPIFPDYVIFCDYHPTHSRWTMHRFLDKNKSLGLIEQPIFSNPTNSWTTCIFKSLHQTGL